MWTAPHLVSQMARMVATKAALSIRVDALTDSDGKSDPLAPSIGIENRAKLESRLRALEQQGDMSGVRRFADNGRKQAKFEMSGETKTYNTQADAVNFVSTQREDPMEIAVKAVLDVKEEKRRAKEERRAKKRAEKEKAGTEGEVAEMDVDGEEKKDGKEKKRKRRESEVADMDVESPAKVNFCIVITRTITDNRHRRRQRKSGRQGKRRRKLRRRRRKQVPRKRTVTLRRRRRRSRGRHEPIFLLYRPSTWIFCLRQA